jgi:hypothetical protein
VVEACFYWGFSKNMGAERGVLMVELWWMRGNLWCFGWWVSGDEKYAKF